MPPFPTNRDLHRRAFIIRRRIDWCTRQMKRAEDYSDAMLFIIGREEERLKETLELLPENRFDRWNTPADLRT